MVIRLVRQMLILKRPDVAEVNKECTFEECGFHFSKIVKPYNKFNLIFKCFSDEKLIYIENRNFFLDDLWESNKKKPVVYYYFYKVSSNLTYLTQSMIKKFYSLFKWHNKKNFASLPNNKNNEKLLKIKNIHKGQRAFIIGNGPSLKLDDLDKLKNEITFASNKIFLAFGDTEWRPNYYTIADHVLANNIKKKVNSLKLKKIFAYSVSNYYKDQKDITFVNPATPEGDKNWDLILGTRSGYSVVNFNLKLAHWMGIREVYVIGVDFSFNDRSIRTGKIEQGNEIIISTGEKNHFHPDYRKQGEFWTIPRLDKMRQNFIDAHSFYEKSGGKIFNASRNTKLDAWERIDFDEVIHDTFPIFSKAKEKLPDLNKSKRVMLYCPDITGHRHLYAAVMLNFFLEKRCFVYVCYAGQITKLYRTGRKEYEYSDSSYLNFYKQLDNVQFINIQHELNSTSNELEVIHYLQDELRPHSTLFLDADFMKWTLLRLSLPFQKQLKGRNYAFWYLSEFIYQPNGKWRLLNEIYRCLKMYYKNRTILISRMSFVIEFPLINRWLFSRFLKNKSLTTHFCPDKMIINNYNNSKMIFFTGIGYREFGNTIKRRKKIFLC